MIGEITEKRVGFSSLMALRTAATSGVGFRHLARKDAKVAGVFGAGGQALHKILALQNERPIETYKVFSRNPDNREKFCKRMATLVDAEFVPVDTPAEVVARRRRGDLRDQLERAGVRRRLARAGPASGDGGRLQQCAGPGRLAEGGPPRERRRNRSARRLHHHQLARIDRAGTAGRDCSIRSKRASSPGTRFTSLANCSTARFPAAPTTARSPSTPTTTARRRPILRSRNGSTSAASRWGAARRSSCRGPAINSDGA